MPLQFLIQPSELLVEPDLLMIWSHSLATGQPLVPVPITPIVPSVMRVPWLPPESARSV